MQINALFLKVLLSKSLNTYAQPTSEAPSTISIAYVNREKVLAWLHGCCKSLYFCVFFISWIYDRGLFQLFCKGWIFEGWKLWTLAKIKFLQIIVNLQYMIGLAWSWLFTYVINARLGWYALKMRKNWTPSSCCNFHEIRRMWFCHRAVRPKDADERANSIDPDQRAPLGADRALWSGSTWFNKWQTV